MVNGLILRDRNNEKGLTLKLRNSDQGKDFGYSESSFGFYRTT